jgi:capsular exopolysaccharide synthesis family protein
MINNINESEEVFNLQELFFQYIRFWKWFLLGAAVAVLIANVYLRYTKSIYETTAKIKILDNSSGGLELSSNLTSLFSGSKVNLDNEMEVLKSHQLLINVVRNLNLETAYYSVGNILNVELWNDRPFEVIWLDSSKEVEELSFFVTLQKNGFEINPNKDKNIKLLSYGKVNMAGGEKFMLTKNSSFSANQVNMKFRVVRTTLFEAVNNLSNSLNMESATRQSDVLNLTLNGESKEKLEDILNDIIDEFNYDGISDRQLVSQRTIDFVTERFEYLSNELDSIETEKQSFKKSNKLSYLEFDAEQTSVKKEFADDEFYTIQTQIALADLLEENLKTDERFELLPANIGVQNDKINVLIVEYNDLILQRKKMLSSAGGQNPMVLELSKRLLEMKQNVLNSIKILQEQLAVSSENIKNLRSMNTASFSRIPEKEKVLRAIDRQQSIKESLYLFLLQKREEASVAKAITTPSIKVVDYAISDQLPIQPKRKFVYLLALVIGILIPFLIIFLLLSLDTKIHGKQDFEKYSSKIPVVAEVPFIHEDNRVIKENDRSILAEAFRILRTNVNYLLPLDKEATANVIYTSSSIKGEGKTFVSLNLALSYASLGKKTLVLGADLRNPQIHKYFNMDKSRLGLSNFLYDVNVDWKTLVNRGLMENEYLDLIVAGAIPPNPAELLSNGRFEILINLLKTEYDYIIIDTAPTILVTDTLLISQLADVTIYVTRANHTDKKLLTYSKELDEKGKMKNMAYVINNVGGVNAYGYSYGYGYGYGYGYNYGYGYGYGEDKENVKTSKFKRFLKKWIS